MLFLVIQNVLYLYYECPRTHIICVLVSASFRPTVIFRDSVEDHQAKTIFMKYELPRHNFGWVHKIVELYNKHLQGQRCLNRAAASQAMQCQPVIAKVKTSCVAFCYSLAFHLVFPSSCFASLSIIFNEQISQYCTVRLKNLCIIYKFEIFTPWIRGFHNRGS